MNNSKVDAPDLIIPPVSFEKKKNDFFIEKRDFCNIVHSGVSQHKN